MTEAQCRLRVLIVHRRPISAAGLRHVVECGPIQASSHLIQDPATVMQTPDPPPDVVLAAPHDWRELGAWIPSLQKRLSLAPWLILAELQVVGLYLPRLESQPCVVVHPGAPAGDLFAGLQAAASHRCDHLPTALLSPLMRRLVRQRGTRISPRAFSVVELAMSCGVSLNLSNREIAEAVQLSEATIKTHLHRLMSRLDLDRRTELADLVNAAMNNQPPDRDLPVEGVALTL